MSTASVTPANAVASGAAVTPPNAGNLAKRTMTWRSPVWRALLWKEARQLLPLIWMLSGVSFLLFLIIATTSQQLNVTLRGVGNIVPLIMPALYAAGAGAILVSHEKESRTIAWLSSLPLSPRPIVGTKMLVAAAGLLVMWIACVLLASISGLTEAPAGGVGPLTSVAPSTWFVHSIYVLLCGFLMSWRVKNAFPALLGIIPLASLPFVSSQIWYAFTSDPHRFVSVEERSWTLGIITAFAIPIIGWLSYRAGKRNLQPLEPENVTANAISSIDAWVPPRVGVPSDEPFKHPSSAMFWQSWHATRLTSFVLLAALVIGVVAVWAISHVAIPSRYDGALLSLIGLGTLAVSWLGVSAFTGDGSSARLKFLADRGMSPTRVWLGRHLMPVSFISAALLLLGVMQLGLRTEIESGVPEPSLLTVVLVVAMIYLVSQWISQTVPMIAASAFLAPVASLMALFWLSSVGMEYGVSIGWLLGCCLIPLLATWWLMRRHMDGRRGIAYWSWTAVAGIGLAVLPWVPVMMAVARFPSMPAKQVVELEPLARQASRAASQPAVSMMLRPWNEPLKNAWMNPEIDGPLAAERLQERLSISPKDAFILPDSDDVAIRADFNVITTALDATSLAYFSWQHDPNEQTAEQLGQWIDCLSSMASGLRKSVRWLDQEIADQIEIELTQMLSIADVRLALDERWTSSAVEQLSDFDGRQAARRRAILVSWIRDAEQEPDRQIFGLSARKEWFSTIPTGWRPAVLKQGMAAVTGILVEMLDAGVSGGDTEPYRHRLHELIVHPNVPYELGPYGSRHEADVGPQAPKPQLDYMPATQWFAPWEDAARRLR